MAKNKAIVAFALISLCLMAFSLVHLQLTKAQYQGNVTVGTDGSVSPLTAPIDQVGNTYLLTGDINGSITVNADNIVFNGNGHTVMFGGGGVGMVSALTFKDVSNVTIKDFIVTGGWFGIAFSGTDCLIANNAVTGTGNGIYSIDNPTAAIGVTGDSNIIIGNYLANNYAGIVFYQGTNNTVLENTIRDTKGLNGVAHYAITFWGGAFNNSIYHNNFENNASPQAFDAIGDSPTPINVWDNGYPGGGNYWDDYQARYPSAKEIDGSRIANVPYVIDSQNKDKYPLMYGFNDVYILQARPPKISLLPPVNQTYSEPVIPISFTTDKVVNWTGYSLDGNLNVTIVGNSTITNLIDGFHTLTVYANDTFGGMGTSPSMNFSVVLPSLTPSSTNSKPIPDAIVVVFVSIAIIAVAVGLGLLVYRKKLKRH